MESKEVDKMGKKPVLVIMAAGMGSRYGGLKQVDPVGPRGEAIMDFSLYDAHEAGFETAVIIIKEAIREDFMSTVGERLKKCPMEIRYAYQELDHLPQGFCVPEGRTKPWGTSHAVLCAKQAIDGAPFAVLNADDYYGKSAFSVIYGALLGLKDDEMDHYCMVGYHLGNTVTEHGSVARGICCMDAGHKLTVIRERLRIEKYPGGIHYLEDDGQSWTDVPADTLVSMNLWGFTPGFLEKVERGFPEFLRTLAVANPLKGEYLLPSTVQGLLCAGQADVSVLRSPDRWYGVTYAADKPAVVAALRGMTERGLYPASGLWD